MKILSNTTERYPEYELVIDACGYTMPKKLYDEYLDSKKTFDKVQMKIERWRDKLPRPTQPQRFFNSGTIICGSAS